MRSAALLPTIEDGFPERIASAAAEVSGAFWQESLAVAPQATAELLAQELARLLAAVGPRGRLQVPKHRGKLSPRGLRHLQDLARLHEATGELLPRELALLRELLATRPEALTVVPVVYHAGDLPPLDPWQQALLAHLQPAAAYLLQAKLQALLEKKLTPSPPQKAPHALAALQTRLFEAPDKAVPRDPSVQWVAVRDAMEEVEIVAGMIQRALEEDPSLRLPEIGLLLPQSAGYEALVERVFHRAGLPVGGMTVPEQRRDLGRELVLHALLCCRTPAPRMAAAAFVTNPLLPWTTELGHALALDANDGNFSFPAANKLEDPEAQALLANVRRGAGSPKALREALSRMAALARLDAPDPEDALPHRQRAREAIATIEALLRQHKALEWSALLAAVQPEFLSAPRDLPPLQEGVAIFTEGPEPWHAVRHLFVLGFAEGHYPADLFRSSVFSGEDWEGLVAAGLPVDSPETVQLRQRRLFRRQLTAAQESGTFLLPRRDLQGKRLHPSASLAFMAQLFEDAVSPEALLLELDRAEHRKKVRWLALAPIEAPTPPRAMVAKDLRLKRDLLTVGEKRHVSPSSLETLLVSPFAWLLERMGIGPSDWAPESVNPLLQGSLAHEVFEHLFTPDTKPPEGAEIEKRVGTLLDQAIGRMAPFLASEEWHVECRNLAAELSRAAIAWADFLRDSGASVRYPEVWLEGSQDGVTLKGRADVLLALPDGRLYVVDYKKSGSGKRRTRMAAGIWIKTAFLSDKGEHQRAVDAESGCR